MSAQPYSRADRNRIRAAFRAGKNGVIVVAIDSAAGSITVASEAHLCARHRAGRPVVQPAGLAPDDGEAAIRLADEGDARTFVAGPSYERLADGSWLVTEAPP